LSTRALTDQILAVLAPLLERDPDALITFSAACLAVGVTTAKAAGVAENIVMEVVHQEYQAGPDPHPVPALRLVH
jgi:hypothetical protein